VTFSEEEATSFGSVAESYDRVRPAPQPEALDWLVPAGCEVAVDLAAGTGLFTRALSGRAAEVIAVEPDERMRAVLTRRSPRLRVLEGRGEAIPLPDASADAVFVSTAWHWFDPARAVPEIARVLRPGGRLGVIWTSRDRTADWVAELDLLRLPATGDRGDRGDRREGDADTEAPGTVAQVRARLERQHTVTLPAGAEFTNAEAASFLFTRSIGVSEAVEWVATTSQFIIASAADRAAALGLYRAALRDRADADQVIHMPMRSWCWRADRI
jgi:SAM-dependent methyltransferase